MPFPLPISLRSAAQHLLSWSNTQHALPEPSSASRFQVPVIPPPPSLLVWLRAQSHPQKIYLRSPSPYSEVAAVGFLHVATGLKFSQEIHQHLLQTLSERHKDQRYYGTTRFDAAYGGTWDPQWEKFNGFTFVLPAVELVRGSDGGETCYLAANYFRKEGMEVLIQVLSRLVATPVCMMSATVLIPRAVVVEDLSSFEAWDKAMKNILRNLELANYDKLVLARRKRFRFHAEGSPKVFDILQGLQQQRGRGGGGMVTYLFCLQLEERVAFLGNTPERLFRVEGESVITEALAATVKRGIGDEDDALAAELMGDKTLQEHAFVVDYVAKALANCGVLATTDGPHVRKLPKLMHLATHIHGKFVVQEHGDSGEKEGTDMKKSRVFQLLNAMHPTPAVCGIPTESTMGEIAELEDFDRGLYAAPFGWFSRDVGEFCVAIRSALVHGGDVTAFAGCGIVTGSESKSEWDESELKLSPFTDLFCTEEFRVSGRIGQQCLGLAVQECHVETSMCTNGKREGANGHVKTYDSSPNDTAGIFSSKVQSGIISDTSMPLGAHSMCMSYSAIDPSASFNPETLETIPNLNTLWGCCCVEELCRNGIDTFFVSPGSRSTPLVVGVARSRYAKSYVAHDERGAGFLAVGYARATGRAAVVITTSGTAVANLLPAIVEASIDSLPMIVVTADRPPELRDVGANQAIYQVNIFAAYARWAKDVPCPSENVPIQNLLSDVDYAVFMSGSEDAESICEGAGYRDAGPVHLNMMFREKLAPDVQSWNRKYTASIGSKWRKTLSPLTMYRSCQVDKLGRYTTGIDGKREDLGGGTLGGIVRKLSLSRAGMIIVGGGNGCIRSEDEGLAIYEIARLLRWPIISDVCGGLRFDNSREGVAIRYADQMLLSQACSDLFVADAILQFGERITAKRLSKLIKACSIAQEGFVHVLVSRSSKRCDSEFTVTHRVQGGINEFLEACKQYKLSTHKTKETHCETQMNLSKLVGLSEKMDVRLGEMMSEEKMEQLTEPWCARVISENIPRPSCLFIGNSMPIRDLDAFSSAMSDGLKIRVAGNRGASGIDGLISSGIGFGVGSNLDVTIVLGDMSLIHDLNALHLLRSEQKELDISVTIVVVNNRGGGIFSMLPISKHEDVMSPFFDTPHAMAFRNAAEMFGLQYSAAGNVVELQNVLKTARAERRHWLIEAMVSNDHASNAFFRQKLGGAVSQFVAMKYL